MCGIGGILGGPNDAARNAAVRRMMATLAHRGPDAHGDYGDDQIALGHTRLSIVDLTSSGAQPMSLGAGGPAITYNGEVYNFMSLRDELEASGQSFFGRSDTEVVLRAYVAWGLEGLKRLEGMFAFALWDPARQRLVLMRDRLGVKPLFYSRSDGRLIFGSEIKSLLAAEPLDRSIDRQALAEFLWYGNAYEDRTIYSRIRALPPGWWLIVEQGKERLAPWWRVEEWLGTEERPRELADCVSEVSCALDAAVSRQLVADVPVGIFLSGGLDSSAIAASAAAVQSRRLASFTAGFQFHGIDELPKARAVARHLGLDHHEFRVTQTDLADTITTLARAHDEPFADAANVPLYLLAARVRGMIKVVLQGDGGDEMFGGYRRYSILRHLGWWRLWPRALSHCVRAAGNTGIRASRMLDAASANDAGERLALLLTIETLADSPYSLMWPDARRSLEATADPFLAYRACAARFKCGDPVQQMLLTDISLQLPSQFLTKVDRATMAAGVEARVPLLDENVARLAVRLPSEWKVRGFEKKVVLRRALMKRLPARILNGPKVGFGVPYGEWLRTGLYDFARDALLSGPFAQRFGFDRAKVEGALIEHKRGHRDHGFRLWKLFQLAIWAARA
jgi:asparagine synthase (glutamine-hydrolysing)